MINPKDLLIITRSGIDDIAQTFYPSDTPGVYALNSLRVYYPAGSTSATITLSVDSPKGTDFDFELFQISAAGGGGANVNLGIACDELKEWYFRVDGSGQYHAEGLKVAQTLGTSDTWSIEASFINAENL